MIMEWERRLRLKGWNLVTFLSVSLVIVIAVASCTRKSPGDDETVLRSRSLPPRPAWDEDFSYSKKVFAVFENHAQFEGILDRVRWRTLKGDYILRRGLGGIGLDPRGGRLLCSQELQVKPEMLTKNGPRPGLIMVWIESGARKSPECYIREQDLIIALERFYASRGNYYHVLDEKGKSILEYDESHLESLLVLIKYSEEDVCFGAAEALLRLGQEDKGAKPAVVSGILCAGCNDATEGAIEILAGRDSISTLVKLYEEAVGRNPSQIVGACLCLVNALERSGREVDAIGMFRSAIKLYPDETRLHEWLGSKLKDIGDLDGAIEVYESATTVDPNALKFYRWAASIYASQKNYAMAAAKLERVMELSRFPDTDEICELINAYIEMGAYAQALRVCDVAIREEPREPKLLFFSGLANHLLGNEKEATAALKVLGAMNEELAEKLADRLRE